MHSEITLPPNALKEYADRATLWNTVELSEKGQKPQLARMLKASLPNEWSYELAEEVVRDYVQRNFVDKGMCADWAIHDSKNDKGQSNLHIHVLLTMRPLTENGEWGAKQKKIYDLDENGEKIPVIDKKTGQQKVDKQNRKLWKCHTARSSIRRRVIHTAHNAATAESHPFLHTFIQNKKFFADKTVFI